MPRLSITLTDKQAEELERIAAETGATKQSMIGLAVTDWIVKYLEKQIVVRPTTEAPQQATEAAQKPAEAENDQTPINANNEPEKAFTVIKTTTDVEVAWMRGRWENEHHKAIICTAMKLHKGGKLQEMGNTWRYELTPIMRAVEGPAVGTEAFKQWATSE